MIAWMAYVTAVGCVVGLGALLAERGLGRMGRPVRWAWVGGMLLTLGLPVMVWLRAPVAAVAPAALDVLVVVVWVAASLGVLANIRLASWTVRRNERSWRSGRVEDHRVLVSASFGPGVVGVRRPRIVLPEWALAASPSLRRVIVLHELEHVRSRDTRLLMGALILAALVPWCLPLWWQLHRLRAAIELDCDRRVVAAGAPRREYAHALVAVAGRGTRSLIPVPRLSPRTGELERRIRFLTARDRSVLAGAALLLIAVTLATVLVALPFPSPAVSNVDPTPPAAATESPGDAVIIFSVGG